MQTTNSSSVLCIGAAHWDVRSQSVMPVRRGTSNPVTVSRYPGGVAHNVAMNLTRLGTFTGLVSYWGQDSAGDALEAELKGRGLRVLELPRSTRHPTATYTAVLEPNGDLAFGLADMAIYDDFSPDQLLDFKGVLYDFPIWFVDTNLPTQTLQALSEWKLDVGILVADAVSVAKSTKLEAIIDKLDLLFCNKDEAAELAKRKVQSHEDILLAGAVLNTQGARSVVISDGEQGAYVFETGGYTHIPAQKVDVVDVTGAGDSLIAGTLYGLSMGKSTEEALRIGIEVTSLTLGEKGATSESLRDLFFGAIGS